MKSNNSKEDNVIRAGNVKYISGLKVLGKINLDNIKTDKMKSDELDEELYAQYEAKEEKRLDEEAEALAEAEAQDYADYLSEENQREEEEIKMQQELEEQASYSLPEDSPEDLAQQRMIENGMDPEEAYIRANNPGLFL